MKMEVKTEKGTRKIQIDFRSCRLCPYRSKSMLLLIAHLRIHRLRTGKDLFVCYSNSPLKYKCNNCSFETDFKLNLHKHASSTHIKLKTKDKPEGTAKSYRCQSCTMETCSMLVFLKHFYIKSTKTKRRFCRLFMCHQCPYSTSNETYFKAHLLLKHSHGNTSNVYKCELCSSFISHKKCSLLNHTLCRHADPEDVKWYQCDLCSFRTKFNSHLQVHLRRHVDPDSIHWFKCDQCPFKTWNGFNLDKHITNIHCEKRFECDLCSYRATFKFKLKMHTIRMHMKPEDIQWFECDQCSYKAKTLEDRRKHVTSKHHSRTSKCHDRH